jgi:uncharacterized NAD(P)/FAD-binding protein YdhS
MPGRSDIANKINTIQVPIAIIGGGFSGAALAWHLRRKNVAAEIAVIEPRAELGRGLAYATTDPAHRINVPATRMILDADDAEHFHRWLIATNYLATDPQAAMPDSRLFPTREAFGRYIDEQVRHLTPAITHLHARAVSACRTKDGFRITCDNGEIVDAAILVLAICHAPPAVPGSLRSLRSHPRFFPDPWREGVLASLSPDDRILIVGTGLTMADIVASLERSGHRGKITAISRRGLRPQSHTGKVAIFEGDFTEPPIAQPAALSRRIRQAVTEAARDGLPWQIVLNRVHEQGQPIWQNLSASGRRQLLRHLRPYWDIHRFRIAPQLDETIEKLIAYGMLDIRAASVKANDGLLDIRVAPVQANPTTTHTITVDLRARHETDWSPTTFDAVMLATGPAHAVSADPLLSSMSEDGLLQADTLGLGIAVDRRGRAVDSRNEPNPQLYVAGPLARGTFGELMGISDLSSYAKQIAEHIASARLAADRPAHATREKA